MERVLLIGVGGFLGSIARFLLGTGVRRIVPESEFPYGTLVVNIVGCALIGVVGALADARGVISEDARAFLIVGLLGGFTTFSAFAYDTLLLLRAGAGMKAGANVFFHLAVCMLAVTAGYMLVRPAAVP
jgi:fluoride exporter